MASALNSFDEILKANVGAFGRGQLTFLLIASLSHIAMASVLMLMVFTAQDPITAGAWECVAATTANSTSAATQHPTASETIGTTAAACAAIRAAVASPGGSGRSIGSSAVDTSNDNTAIKEAATESPPPPPPPTNPTALRTAFCALPTGAVRWTRPATSLLSYYGLTCGREWLVSLLDSFYFVGLAVGGMGFGALSDRHGRRTCMYGCTALAVVVMVAEALAPSFWLHGLCRVVGAAAIQGMAIADVVFVTELVGPDYRGRVGILTQSFFIAGCENACCLSWLR